METLEVIAARETARSLYVVYRQLPAEAQRVFKVMLANEPEAGYTNEDWLALSTPTLKDIWDTPEEDYWDDLYAKQYSNQ